MLIALKNDKTKFKENNTGYLTLILISQLLKLIFKNQWTHLNRRINQHTCFSIIQYNREKRENALEDSKKILRWELKAHTGSDLNTQIKKKQKTNKKFNLKRRFSKKNKNN